MAGIADMLIGGFEAGTRLRQNREAEERQSKLASLYSSALSGGDRSAILPQMAAIDPESAMRADQAFNQQEDRRAGKLREHARLLASLPPQMRPQAYASMVPELQQMGLGDGLPPEWSDELMPTVEAIANSGQSQNVPAGFDAAHRTLIAAGFQPGTPEYERGMRIEAGLEPGFGKSAPRSLNVDINGTPTQVTFDPTTRQYIPATVGGSPMGDPFGFLAQAGATVTSGLRTPERNAKVGGVPNSYHLSGQARDILPPTDPQQAAFIQQQAAANGLEVIDEGDHWHLEPRPGTPIIGRRKEDEAAAKEAAERRVGLQFAPAEAAANAERERLAAEAKAGVERGQEQRQRDMAFSQFQTAMQATESALRDTATNPVAGAIPALTANQQIAEGAVAAMAPILKQLFRSAGEGVFTDKDQELLMAMMPTRSDHPEAVAAKLANIRAIVAAKLGQGGAPADVPQTESQGNSGGWKIEVIQ